MLNQMLLTNIDTRELARFRRAMGILRSGNFVIEGSTITADASPDNDLPAHFADMTSCTCQDHTYRGTICKHMEARIWLWIGEFHLARALYPEVLTPGVPEVM